MRIASVVVSSLFVLACGSGRPATPATPATTPPPTTPGAAPLPLGTSGYPGLDWGANADAIKAAAPGAEGAGDSLSHVGGYPGQGGYTTFALEDGGLATITVRWDEPFRSMEDCELGWSAERLGLDRTLGPSLSDNLAAYWESPTYAITLACNPGDGEEAVLSLSYQPPSGE